LWNCAPCRPQRAPQARISLCKHARGGLPGLWANCEYLVDKLCSLFRAIELKSLTGTLRPPLRKSKSGTPFG
jgi:hypothetical protein